MKLPCISNAEGICLLCTNTDTVASTRYCKHTIHCPGSLHGMAAGILLGFRPCAKKMCCISLAVTALKLCFPLI